MVSTRGHRTNVLESPDARTPVSITTQDVTPSRRVAPRSWMHTPSNLTLLWLVVSIPIVLWDTGYILFRPHTMPGGWMHSPIWKPYALYVNIDYVYGWPAWNAKDGFGGAQAFMNLIECAGYCYYLYIVWTHGRHEKIKGRGAPDSSMLGRLTHRRTVSGSWAATAVLLAWTVAVMTVSKTVLYALNDAFSGFKHTRHNSMKDLIFLYILPNGMWLVFPSYIIAVLGKELIEGLNMAANPQAKASKKGI